MANAEHVERLSKGVATWNAWLVQNAEDSLDLSGANLSWADLCGADLRRAELIGANLRRGELRGAKLCGADLRLADLRLADFRLADLSGTDLSRADLSGADLRRADLSESDLRGTDLSRADLSEANLSRADLREANLRETNLREANLIGTDLSETQLLYTNLSVAKLGNANLTKAILRQTNFGGADLRGAKGLSECEFTGPCVLDLEAIQKSGRLPMHFLRGCGLPDSLIDYLPCVLNEPVQFFSCFISYSTSDQEFANQLNADLQNKGVRCWFEPHDIQGIRKAHKQIDEAIRVYNKLLLVLSDASMSSNWVKTEIANARAREEQQKRQMLFPITLVPFDRIKDWKLLDGDQDIDSARKIRESFIPDFSEWKNHDSYTKAFERLFRDLDSGGSRVRCLVPDQALGRILGRYKPSAASPDS